MPLSRVDKFWMLPKLPLANEVIDVMLKKKERCIQCKLEIEKAYDQINLEIYFECAKRYGVQ